ncbi:MAG: YfhO family protein [Bacteroidales bacterium]|nr:YfhO family protein [Bacteroidales bacterium]
MKNISFKKFIPHAVAIGLFLLITFIYVNPVFQGKQIHQGDIVNFKGMSKEIVDFREATGDEPLWTNSMFGGMPAYQISMKSNSNLMHFIDDVLTLGLPHPAGLLFLNFLGFYILLLVLGVNPWLSIVGAIGYCFSTYFFIIIEAGHNSKAHAMTYMAPVLAGIILSYKGKYILGAALTAFFLALQIATNHLQITYYLMFIVFFIGIAYAIDMIKNNKLPEFIKASSLLIIAALFAVATNSTLIMTTLEYSKYSTRGQSELSLDNSNTTSGLDKEYATQWSYGIDETLNLLIPNFKGGGSNGPLDTDSETYEALRKVGQQNPQAIIKNLPLYWGTQPFTSGPVYIGAILIFLFVLGLIIIPGRLKWALLASTILSIILAWGSNFMELTGFFLDYFPGYNKFRTVSMILVIAELTIPILAMLALSKIFSGNYKKEEIYNGLKWSLGLVGGIVLIFTLAPGLAGDFVGMRDIQQIPDWLAEALQNDRKALLRQDAIRSLLLIVASAGSIVLFITKKFNNTVFIIVLGVLVTFDMWSVDKRYLNEDNFVSKRKMEVPFPITAANQQILMDKDPDFRVLNLTVNTMSDASTSYYHKSLGGYHGAKMKRYQELYDQHIQNNNMEVVHMLNTKYLIIPNQERTQAIAQRNPFALGHAWFVQEINWVENADQEIAALSTFEAAKTAIIDVKYKEELKGFTPSIDSTANIHLESYQPNQLIYKTTASKDQLAVFSEIYYPVGWKVSIDGQEASHISANYVLRSMIIPAGEHTIEFKFEPSSYYTGEKISLASSVLIILLVIGALVAEGLKNKKININQKNA